MILTIIKGGFLTVCIVICLVVSSFAQDGLSNTIHGSHTKHTSTHKTLKQFYKRPGKNKMYSNECVHDYTSSKGYEYVILTGDCERALSNMSTFELEWHNFTTGLGLVFSKGPFWKIKMKRQFKICKERMGDIIE